MYLDCNCNADGSEDLTCDATGKCHCKCNVDGDKCDTCQAGWHSFPACHGKGFYKNVYKGPQIMRYLIFQNVIVTKRDLHILCVMLIQENANVRQP